METITVSAVTLKSFPFKDRQYIITALSEELGVIGILIKGVSLKQPHKLCFCEPFCTAVWVLRRNRGNLFLFCEGSNADLRLPLRAASEYILTGSRMIKALLRSQLPEKPAPLLYKLFLSFLRNIPRVPCQNTLLACFYLKLLQHEGIFPFFSEGAYPEEISPEERLLFQHLVSVKNFTQIGELRTRKESLEKLEALLFSEYETKVF